MTDSPVSAIPPPPGTENPPLPPLSPNNTPSNQQQPNWPPYYYNSYYNPQYAQYYQFYMMNGYNHQYAAYQAQLANKGEGDKIQPPLPPRSSFTKFQLNGKRLPNSNAIMQQSNSPNSGAAKKKRKRNRNNQNNQFNQQNNFNTPPLPPPELNLPKPAPPPETMPPEPPLPPLPDADKPPLPSADNQELSDTKPPQNGFSNPSDDWPESLKDYVHRSYAKCKTAIDKNQVEIILKGKITQAYQSGQLNKDWSKESLPNIHSERQAFTGQVKTVPGQLAQFQNNKKGLSPGLGARLGARASTLRGKSRSSSRSRSRSRSPAERRTSRSRSRSPRRHHTSSGSSTSSSDENFKPVAKNGKKSKGKLADRLGPTKNKLSSKALKKQKAKEKKASFYSTFGQEVEENNELLQQRAARFNNTKMCVSSTMSLTSPSKRQTFVIDKFSEDNSTMDFDWSDCHIVGTCQDLEKSFLRLTKAPDPCDIRPVEVLKLSLQNVKDKWMQKQDYFYACDQLKSIRQDLTVSDIFIIILLI
ncbi:hypothetical protein NQ314_004977 [Rhamnusium bicolor]|uniref:Leukocyte receptor cluster member 8-like protein n=1 Tax=Rhamnusium bicolor TaxID=1586634 RepID=A0AAV8ZKF1_9CUCU|nr:hypothetical protein NQ314_004977 [Rhamnusium bicolor]